MNSEERNVSMRKSVRLAVAACAGLVALAIAGPAWAVYRPALVVVAQNPAPAKKTTVLIGVAQTAADDPTLKIQVYAPLGYLANLTQPVGATIGDVEGDVILRDLGGAIAPIKGTVKVDNPQAHLTDPCAPGLHQAIWSLNVTIAGSPLTVYLYVDTITSGPEAAFASVKIQLCLAGPIGTPGGAQLLDAFFDINGVFTNPTAGGYRVWRSTFTPYIPGTPNPNPAGTVEAQAFAPSAVSVKLKVVSGKRGRITISGRLLVQGSPFAGADIDLYIGNKKVGRTLHTNRSGRFTTRRRIKRKTAFRALATFVGDRPGGCAAPAIAPAGCVNATIAFIAVSNKATGRFRR